MAYILTTLLLGGLVFAIYYARTCLARYMSAERQNCQLPPRRDTRDPILGIQYKIEDAKAMKQIKTLPAGTALHRQYGPTYCESSLFGTTIKTVDEGNIRTVFGDKAKEWGIQPFRLAGMRPFCGLGVLSTDGSVWEHSRAMLKPWFHKSNISDLTDFERSVGHTLARIPRDGSTIDMGCLISTLV